MRIFRWICWLRGYHISPFVLQDYWKQTRDIGGQCANCSVCGLLPDNGPAHKGFLWLKWGSQ